MNSKRGKTESQHGVSVVIPTVLRPTLMRAVRSVFNQDLGGRIPILIGGRGLLVALSLLGAIGLAVILGFCSDYEVGKEALK